VIEEALQNNRTIFLQFFYTKPNSFFILTTYQGRSATDEWVEPQIAGVAVGFDEEGGEGEGEWCLM